MSSQNRDQICDLDVMHKCSYILGATTNEKTENKC